MELDKVAKSAKECIEVVYGQYKDNPNGFSRIRMMSAIRSTYRVDSSLSQEYALIFLGKEQILLGKGQISIVEFVQSVNICLDIDRLFSMTTYLDGALDLFERKAVANPGLQLREFKGGIEMIIAGVRRLNNDDLADILTKKYLNKTEELLAVYA
ncbi:MAG TPA: hypothetical protein VJC00_03160 [Candidatus Nanoarchaeia archaeon]|nr:hypothetical protein [Candidatus Nanoarchaeia archaeon]